MFAIMRKITFSSVWFSSPCTMRCKGAMLVGGINIATCALLYIFYDFVCVFMPHMPHVCGGLRATFKSGTGFPPSPLLSHGLSCFCYTVYFKLAGPQALERLSCLLTSSEQECWGCRNEESHLAILMQVSGLQLWSSIHWWQVYFSIEYLPSPACFSSWRTCFRVGNIRDKVGLYRPFEEMCRVF